MSNNNRRGAIQLPTTEQDSHQSSLPRSSLRWSIPCCTSFPLINGRSGVIRLPEDSDEDEDQQSDEFIIPFEAIAKTKHGYLQSQAIDHLSHNPFARVTKTYEPNEHEEESQTGEDDDNDLLENASQQTLREEELVNLDKNSIHRNIKDAVVTEDEGYKVEIDTDEEDNIATNSLESSDTQQEATTSHLASDTEEQSKTLLDDKVPQIEEDILQHLPLPRLSQEIPKDMIHQKLLFEKLICDEEHLVSTRSVNKDDKDNYSSLLSINEEESFVATKDDGKNEQKSAELNNDTLAVENELAIGDISTVSSPLPNEQVKLSSSSAPSQEMMIMKPTASQKNHSGNARERRSSVVATATQSILGDKLEDFTEKLAFIKKTIIMNIDSSDEEEEEFNSSDRFIKKTETINQPVKNTNSSENSLGKRPPKIHRRASSLMDVAPTIAKLMNQIGNTLTINEEKPSTQTNLSSSQSSTSSFSPSSLFAAFAGQPATVTSTSKKQSEEKKKAVIKEEEEDLFDFTKVIEIGKNVKSFSEGFVGNGIRMFNDVAIRVKTTVDQQQEAKGTSLNLRQENGSTSSITSINNNNNEEEAWMHNYL